MNNRQIQYPYLPVIILSLWFASLAACSTGESQIIPSQKPAHHTESGFRNLYIEDPDKNFFDFLRVRLFGDTVWADHELEADLIPRQPVDVDQLQSADQAQVTWLGHSTFLIQRGGVHVLTDPIFSDFASPLSFAGPRRYVPHMMDYADLPVIHHVVISHNHYDHLDSATIQQLGNEPLYHVPLGLAEFFRKAGIAEERIREYDWWQAQDLDGIRIEALPSQHWSARGLFDRYQTLWASWLMVFDDYRIWFAGDTGYNPVQFKDIGAHIGSLDLALIPIGAYSPRSFMKPYHVNPDEAVRMHKDLRAERSIGMHWGTFPLTAERPTEPLAKLQEARERYGVNREEFGTLSLGETRRL